MPQRANLPSRLFPGGLLAVSCLFNHAVDHFGPDTQYILAEASANEGQNMSNFTWIASLEENVVKSGRMKFA